MTRERSTWAGIVALVLGGACRQESAPEARGESAFAVTQILRVHRASDAPKIDGELGEADWQRAARTGAFVDEHGHDARPYSEARFLWDAQALYVGVYAADEDIRCANTKHDGAVWLDDSFALHLRAPKTMSRFQIDVSATGIVTDTRNGRDPIWESGVSVGVDRDGTLNDASDDDEEWVTELRIPLASIGVVAAARARVEVAIERCDQPKGARRRCGRWAGRDGAMIALEFGE